MKIKVQVTEEDIATGKRNSCSRCPVALAISRAINREVAVNGREYRVFYVDPDGREFDLPNRLWNWIKRFDNHAPCLEPIEFELDLP